MCATGAGFPSRHAAPRQRLKHTRKDAAPRLPSRTMACVARAVPVRVLRVPPQPLQQRRRGGCAGPVRAVPSQRRGWGETDSRFSRLDKRRDGDGGDGGDGGGEAGRDSERNISFQELRKRQDREQRHFAVHYNEDGVIRSTKILRDLGFRVSGLGFRD